MVMEESVQTAFMQRIIKQGLIWESATAVEPSWKKAAKDGNEDLSAYAYSVIIDGIENPKDEIALKHIQTIQKILDEDPGKEASEDTVQTFLKLLDIKEKISGYNKKISELEKELKGYDEKVKDPVLKIKKTVHVNGLQEIVDQAFGPRFRLKAKDGFTLARDFTFRSGYTPSPVPDGGYFSYKVEE